MSEQDEVERLKRIRNQQLNTRDFRAQSDQRRSGAIKRESAKNVVSIEKVLKAIPAKVTWMLLGVFIGFWVGAFIGFILTIQFGWYVMEYTDIAGMFWGGFVGFAMGRAKDSGKEGWRGK